MSELRGDVILEARAITRHYPGTIALNAVDFRVYRNQVNVVIGENGAGKSTLMRILAGVESPDEGVLRLEGVPADAAVAARSGAAWDCDRAPGIVGASESRSCGEHLCRDANRCGLECSSIGGRKRAGRRRHCADCVSRWPLRQQAGQLSLGSRQVVEVARTLDQGAQVLILDEPTSALSNAEAETLFGVIAELKRSGVTIIYISHRLNELLHLGDEFTVLRSGRVVGEAPRAR